MYGTVKMYKPERGYGFIHSSGDEDTFFHVSDFPPDTEPFVGQPVEFRIGQRKGRPLALDIKLLPAAMVAEGGAA